MTGVQTCALPICLSVTAINAVTAITVAISGNGLSGTTGAVAVTSGSYASGIFTAAAADSTHKDLLVQWDTNGSTAGGVESVVIVGAYATAAATAASVNGVITFTVV